jgi:hypothetical protein
MDYEYQPANHINFRLAHLVLVPFTFAERDLRRYGASPQRTQRYHGLKEDVHLDGFRPDPLFRETIHAYFTERGLAMGPEHVFVVVRPPATMAAYHRFENPVFAEVLSYLGTAQNTRVLLFARTPEQATEIRPRLGRNTLVADRSFEGRNLIYHADLVVSAGGTMNREAAAMGVPAYTIYAGRMGSVDRYLIESGKMTSINGAEDFPRIRIEKKNTPAPTLRFNTRNEILDTLLRFAESYRMKRSDPTRSG